MKLKGMVEVWSLNKEGNVKKYLRRNNTILNVGKEAIFKYANDAFNRRKISRIGIGTDNTSPDSSQTGLLNEVRCELGTVSVEGDFVIKIEHTFINWTTPSNICEAGIRLCDAYNCGSKEYLNRVTFDPVTCDENNNIKIKFTLTVID